MGRALGAGAAAVLGSSALGAVVAGCCGPLMATQSMLVPFPEPVAPPTSHGAGDVYAAVSGLTAVAPNDSAAGLGHYVPAAQIHVVGSIRPVGGLQIRPLMFYSLPDGATAVRADLLERPGTASVTGGVDVGWTFGDEGEPYLVRLHLGIAVLAAAARTRVDAVGAVPRRRSDADTAFGLLYEGGVDAGAWVAPWLLVLGSLDVRNAGAAPATVIYDSCESWGPPYFDTGSAVLSARVSAEIEIERHLGLVVGVAVPIVGAAFDPYPIVTAGLRGSFGTSWPRRVRRWRHGRPERALYLADPSP